MIGRLRRSPPICALVAIGGFIIGRIRFSRTLTGQRIETDDGVFTVFRHMTRRGPPAPTETLFVVRFRFARFSQRTNRWLSLIPVLAIAGYPGFRDKLWLVNEETGHWEGLYRWESADAVEAYRRSLVLGVMNRRAQPGTVEERVIAGTTLEEYLAHPPPG